MLRLIKVTFSVPSFQRRPPLFYAQIIYPSLSSREHVLFHLFRVSPSTFTSDSRESSRLQFSSAQFSQSCPALCDPMDCSTPGLPVHHQLSEYTQTQVHQVSDAIKTSHPLLSPSLPAFSLSQIRVFSNESVLPIKVLWFQLQHEPFQ